MDHWSMRLSLVDLRALYQAVISDGQPGGCLHQSKNRKDGSIKSQLNDLTRKPIAAAWPERGLKRRHEAAGSDFVDDEKEI